MDRAEAATTVAITDRKNTSLMVNYWDGSWTVNSLSVTWLQVKKSAPIFGE